MKLKCPVCGDIDWGSVTDPPVCDLCGKDFVAASSKCKPIGQSQMQLKAWGSSE